ncbi:MAG: beta-glucosidase [Pyrinomonadaceae bacterium]
MRNSENPFKSFFMGGFECSSHRSNRGRRLDLIASTRHEEFAYEDYARLRKCGILTARDGLRWHLIERAPGKYDFSSVDRQIAAARANGVQIVWDVFHYGYPDNLDIFSSEFIRRFAAYSAALTQFLRAETGEPLILCPINEISFFAWIAGSEGIFFPYTKRRGRSLKRQLVRAAVASVEAIKDVAPSTQIIFTDPAIHVVPSGNSLAELRAAENYRRSQFQAFDMLLGRVEPELGGHENMIDILGLNYYFHNQWRHPSRRKIPLGHGRYRPLREILTEYYARYGKPMFIAETGIEDERRPDWFRYVCDEIYALQQTEIPLLGICLYPIVNHPGWADNRHCHNGLWDYADDKGEREIYEPLANEIVRQNERFRKANFKDQALAA